jgi:hypothetical protein
MVTGEIELILSSGMPLLTIYDGAVLGWHAFTKEDETWPPGRFPEVGELLVFQNTSSPYDWRLWIGSNSALHPGYVTWWTTTQIWILDSGYGHAEGVAGEVRMDPAFGIYPAPAVMIHDSGTGWWWCPDGWGHSP